MRKRHLKRTRTGEYHFLSDSDTRIFDSQRNSTKDRRNTGIQSIYNHASDTNRYTESISEYSSYSIPCIGYNFETTEVRQEEVPSVSHNNSVASLKRNNHNPDRIQYQQHSNGKSNFNLRAGNSIKIATSSLFDDAAEHILPSTDRKAPVFYNLTKPQSWRKI